MKEWLQMINLSKKYGRIVALDSLNLSLEEGITLLLGPNGSGKSTIVSMAEGLTRPTRGEILVTGLSPFFEPSKLFQKVTFIPERPTYFSSSKVIEFLFWYAKFKNSKLEEIKNMMSRFNIEKLYESNVSQLSMGEMQLVELAAALSCHSEYYVLDEPNANVDPSMRLLMTSIFSEFSKKDKSSFLISSHIIDELLPVSDFIVNLRDGRLNGPGISVKARETERIALIYSTEPDNIYKVFIHSGLRVTRNGYVIVVEMENNTNILFNILNDYLSVITNIKIIPKFEGVNRYEII